MESLAAESSEDEEVSVINTFVHVGPRRKRTTASAGKTAPERILTAAAEAAVMFSDAEHVRDTRLEDDGHGNVSSIGNFESWHSRTTDSFETSSAAESQSDEDEKLSDKNKMRPQGENRQLLELSDLIHDSRKERTSHSAAMQGPQACMHVVPVHMSMILVPSIMLQSPNTSTISSSPEGLRQAEVKTIIGKRPAHAIVGPARLDKEVTDSGKECVSWIVDGRKLESNCNQLLSREFELNVPGAGPQPFKLMLHAKASKARGSKGFHKACGRSLLFLKCEASLPSTAGCLAVQVRVGRELPTELSSSPIRHHFLDQNCCPLQQEGDWNLLKVVDQASKYFEIFLEVLDQ